MEYTVEQLGKLPHEELLSFIRKRLSFSDKLLSQLKHLEPGKADLEHRRFEMSGYEDKTGQCTLHNLAIVNVFADLGIYDYTNYLFLDFYKGTGTIYLQYFSGSEHLQFNVAGYGTTEIISEILKLTIFSGRATRRRN